MKYLLTIATFASLFILQISNISAQVLNPTGDLSYSEPDDIWAQTMEGSHFNEFWNYHFFLNDNVTLYVTFSVANFGSLKSAVSGVQVSVHNLGNKIYQLSREYNLDYLVQDRERFMFRNRMEREIYFEGKLPESHRIRINTSKDGIEYDIDLQLKNIAKGLKWGDGNYRIDRENVGIVTHIPYAEAEGFISVDGHYKDVHGSAYMDHTYQNQTTTRLVNSGYRYVEHSDRHNWDIFYFMLPSDRNERSTIGLRLQNINGNIQMKGIENITNMEKNDLFGDSVAELLEIKFGSGERVEIRRTNDIERFSVLSELNRFARSVARRFLGGEVIHFRGEATLNEGENSESNGYYNYFIVD